MMSNCSYTYRYMFSLESGVLLIITPYCREARVMEHNLNTGVSNLIRNRPVWVQYFITAK